MLIFPHFPLFEIIANVSIYNFKYVKCPETAKETKSHEKILFLFHFLIRRVFRNRRKDKNPWKYWNFQGIFLFLLFLDTFEYGKCLETGETTKYLEVSRNKRNNKIPWKVIISRDLVFLLFLDTFCINFFFYI